MVISDAWAHAGKDAVRNLLTLEPDQAIRMIHRHRTKSLFVPDTDDNLTSWSSSLPFVIQYAMWRVARRSCPMSEVFICAADSIYFPEE